jgi:hypothetical protein
MGQSSAFGQASATSNSSTMKPTSFSFPKPAEDEKK